VNKKNALLHFFSAITEKKMYIMGKALQRFQTLRTYKRLNSWLETAYGKDGNRQLRNKITKIENPQASRSGSFQQLILRCLCVTL
jgi:hypothetical protein